MLLKRKDITELENMARGPRPRADTHNLVLITDKLNLKLLSADCHLGEITMNLEMLK